MRSDAATNEQSWGQSQPSDASGSFSRLSSARNTISVAEAGFSLYVRGADAAAAHLEAFAPLPQLLEQLARRELDG